MLGRSGVILDPDIRYHIEDQHVKFLLGTVDMVLSW